MNLLIEIPTNYPEERDYILEVICQEFLGLDYSVQRRDRRNVRISASDGCELVLADGLFQTSPMVWLTDRTLPRQPLQWWDISDYLGDLPAVPSSVPVIYGTALSNGSYCRIANGSITLGLDIFGSAFFMLSRYEEAVKHDRDRHNRFPAGASLAQQEGFLDRPLVNEYLEILWACLNKMWPQLQRKPQYYRARLSHDVDHPLSVVDKPWPAVLRNAGGDLLRRKDVRLAARRLYARLASYGGNFDADPCNTFDFIMDAAERRGLRDAFYFITGRTAGVIDGDYSVDLPWVRKLMRRIHSRGHEIGLHPSYNTFRDADRTRTEFEKLLRVADQEGIQQSQWGGRQHYLRWEASTTWQNWEDAGLSYDSTLSYADHSGFRSGVCYEYPAFNLHERQRLTLRERPLVVMDAALFGKDYMHLSPQAARIKITELAETCKKFNGQFTLLWHNSELLAAWQKRLYLDSIDALV